MEKNMTVRCNKTLVDENGKQCFTEGNLYKGVRVNIIRNLITENDQKKQAKIGDWFTHFVEVKKYNNFR